MFNLPQEVYEKLRLACIEQGMAMFIIGNSAANIHIVVIGPKEASPTGAAILSANLLLEGVINGNFESSNEETLKKEIEGDLRKPS